MKGVFTKSKIGRVLVIAPDTLLIKKLRDACALIRKTDPQEYRRVENRLNMIIVSNLYGYTNEFFMPERIWITNKSLLYKNDVPWLASLIVHEAFHATQFQNGKYILPLARLEPPALKAQEKFLKKVGHTDENVFHSLIKKRYWEAMGNDTRSYAHFRNLLLVFSKGKRIT